MMERNSRALVWLDAEHLIDSRKFGRKAQNLSIALSSGCNVPAGFCISIDLANRIRNSNDKSRYERLLAREFIQKIISSSKSQRLIVRSSSLYEDSEFGMFSGVFDSYANLQTTEQVLLAIEKIVTTSDSKGLKPYFSEIDSTFRHMGIIVQDQVIPEFSGMARFDEKNAFIEIVRGDLSGMVSGLEKCCTFSLDIRSGEFEVVNFSDLSHSDIGIVAEAFQAIDLTSLVQNSNSPSIEFAFNGEDISILQFNKTHDSEIFHDDVELLHHDLGKGLNHNLGKKASAMSFFKEHDLFSNSLTIVKRGAGLRTVLLKLKRYFSRKQRESRASATTVRFSFREEIGLPRGFVETYEDGVSFVQAHYKKDYTTIIHDYIDVQRSFEILINGDECLIEHVPGMWESYNTQQPDVALLSKKEAKAYLYRNKRAPKVDKYSSEAPELSKPLTRKEWIFYIGLLQDVVDKVKAKCKESQSINIHAVWDGQTQSIQCLNIRKGFDVPNKILVTEKFFVIEKPSDFDKWDKSTPIRFSLVTERGNEISLVNIARKISETGIPIVVDFGLLSHPAMILRDQGNVLIPSYMLPNIFGREEYDVYDLHIDVGHDPINRILSEGQVCESDDYHIVYDREPIGSSHLLCVSKDDSISSKDTGCISEVLRINANYQAAKPFFFERGRAAFCTSSFTFSRDHFHLVTGLDNIGTFDLLRAKLNPVEIYDSLQEAYQDVPKHGEYFVFGSGETGYCLSNTTFAEKRVFRKSVKLL